MSDDIDWVRDAVFYEIFPDRFANGDQANDPPGTVPWNSTPTRENFFGGDLVGITDKLPYIADLGITAIYLTPVFRAGTNHRYDTQDYLEIDPALGDEASLRRLVDAAHDHGIRILLDGVFNHVGDGFWAFRDVAANGPASEYWSWFEANGFPIVTDPPNYQTCGDTAYMPKLNTANPIVRRYLLDVGKYWIDRTGIDGWRLDVPWKAARELWQEFRPAIKNVRSDAYLVGEIWHSWDGWFEVFDGLMNYRLRHRLLDFCVRDSMDAEDLAIETQTILAATPDPTLMLNLLGSHDTERLMTVAGGNEARVMLALTALFTFPGVPMLYYGDELGLEGGNDPDCRRAMPWQFDERAERMRQKVKELTAWRKDRPALRRGSWEPVRQFNRVLAYLRRYDSDVVLAVLNAGPAQREVRLPLPPELDGRWISDNGTTVRSHAGQMLIEWLPTHSSTLLTPSR
jgi:cyclomaltodextrinase